MNPAAREPWQPITMLANMARAVDDHVAQLEVQHAAVEEARSQPFTLDAATVAHVIRVHIEVLEDAALFDEQLARWRGVADASQRAELDRLQGQMVRYRVTCEGILAMASELRRCTVQAVPRIPDAVLDLAALAGGTLQWSRLPFTLPDGVTHEREALGEGSVRYHFAHGVLGRLGHLTCRPRPDGGAGFVSEVVDVPSESRERRRERVELFLPLSLEWSRRLTEHAGTSGA